MSSISQAMPSAPYNPYLEDTSAMPSNGAAYYQAQPSFAAPAQPVGINDCLIVTILTYPAPIPPLRPYRTSQRGSKSVPKDRPRFLHPKHRSRRAPKEIGSYTTSNAQYVALCPKHVRILTNVAAQLPVVDHYHSLVPLDTNHNKSAAVFGYPSWVYKATSSKNGLVYVLRRLEGTSFQFIRSVILTLFRIPSEQRASYPIC
jgi:PAB-dependent poly(A)-specific ribonuclease subunit 3